MSAAAGCTTGMEMPRRDANGGDEDAGRDGGGGMDAGGRTCDADPDCDDGFTCTVDTCGVGHLCSYTTLDERCNTAAGEHCVAGRGCVAGSPTECETPVDCDDGDYCNGVEQCLGPSGSRMCVAGAPVNCNDGNSCTVDTCDGDLMGCTYDIAPGCDAGAMGFDGGTPCDPFEAADYPGTFTFRPAAISACTSSATYNISEIVVTTGSTLSIRADRFTLTQSPAPTDGTFDVTYSDSCATFRLQGMFTCANSWTGTWTATFGGSCAALCSNQMSSVRGSRR